MSQELIERKKASAEAVAQRFDDMAARIRNNGTETFGGAFLVVPPSGTGEPVDLLMFSTTNPGHFWMMVKAHVDEQYKLLQERMAAQQRFG